MTLTPQVRGYKSRMVMGFEDDFNTLPGTPDGVVMPFNSEGLRGSREKTTAETITGKRDPARPFDDVMDVSGPITVPVDVINFGFWLKAFFGDPESEVDEDQIETWGAEDSVALGDIVKGGDHYFKCTTAGTTGAEAPTWTTERDQTVSDGTVVWTDLGDDDDLEDGDLLFVHEYKTGDVQPSMWLERRYSGPSAVLAYALYGGVKASTLALAARGRGELTAEIGLLGASESLENTPADATPDELDFTRFQQFQASIKEADVEIQGTIREMDINLNMGLEDDNYTIGDGGARGDIPESLMTLEGNLTALFRNVSKALLDKAIASTETSLELIFSRESGESLSILFPELELARNAPTIDGPRGATISLPWVAYLNDDARESSVIVTLKNLHKAYAEEEST